MDTSLQGEKPKRYTGLDPQAQAPFLREPSTLTTVPKSNLRPNLLLRRFDRCS